MFIYNLYNYDIWVCLTKGESTQNGDFDRENDEALNIWGNLGGTEIGHV